jgi:hypothetical protein
MSMAMVTERATVPREDSAMSRRNSPRPQLETAIPYVQKAAGWSPPRSSGRELLEVLGSPRPRAFLAATWHAKCLVRAELAEGCEFLHQMWPPRPGRPVRRLPQ